MKEAASGTHEALGSPRSTLGEGNRLEHYRRLFELTPALIIQLDLDSRFVEVNDACCRALGYTREELLQRDYLELVHPDDVAATLAESRRIITGGAPSVGFHNRLRRRDGSYLWLNWYTHTDLQTGRHYCVVEDVTEKVEMERLLQQTGRLARIGGWELDVASGRILWSDEVYRIHEVPVGEAVALESALDFYPPAARTAVKRALDRAARDGGAWDLEVPFVIASGRQRFVRVVGEAERDGDAVVRLFGTIQDITARRRAEEARRRSDEHFHRVFDVLPLATLVLSADGELRGNHRYQTTIGWPPAAFANDAWLALMVDDPAARAAAAATWRALAEAPSEAEPPELDLRCADGKVRSFALRVAKVDEMTTILFEEVGERRRLIREIEAQDRLLRELHRLSADTERSLDEKIERLLALSAEHLGFDLVTVTRVDGDEAVVDYLHGGSIGSVVPGSRGPLAGSLTEVITRRAEPLVVSGRGENGLDSDVWRSFRPKHLIGVALQASKRAFGALIFTGGRARQLSERELDLVQIFAQWLGYELERHRVHLDLSVAVERAQAASRAKSTFLATMSHELRTPLNGVIGMVDILLHDPAARVVCEQLATVKASGLALLNVLNQILDLSKIEAGKITLEEISFSPPAMIGEIVDLMRPRATQVGLVLRERVEWLGDHVVIGDPLRIRQIVLNFIDNAIKFTPEGAVDVELSARREGRQILVRIAVADRGPGIAADELDRLFKPFEQLANARGEAPRGTGLGLSISRELALRMGGTTGCVSHVGVGSTFWLEVPLPIDDAAPPRPELIAPPAVEGSPFAGRKVLVAEDEPVNRLIVTTMLESLGCEVDAVTDGRAAVERAGVGYAAIMMDCRMPVLDGLAASQAIRALAGPVAGTPIVALTANAMEGDRERCLAAGMNDFMAKPVTLEQLVVTLRRLWAARAG
ncbi:MAG: PAS domain S-box protein [Nannocystaceae bacterium]